MEALAAGDNNKAIEAFIAAGECRSKEEESSVLSSRDSEKLISSIQRKY